MAKLVYQFKITLGGIEPVIWRRIQVPAEYSFWDLHVAIQDAMGWLDYHLHAFYPAKAGKRNRIEIGIPMDEPGAENVLAGWEVPIADWFGTPGTAMRYEYDFGDGWSHEVLLEGILLREKGVKYPLCIAGERAAPPEDCGGIPGYWHLLEVLQDPDSPEYDDLVYWLKHHAKNYHPYNPERFSPGEVTFWSPKKRWKMAFEQA
jgi:hypothetical protein